MTVTIGIIQSSYHGAIGAILMTEPNHYFIVTEVKGNIASTVEIVKDRIVATPDMLTDEHFEGAISLRTFTRRNQAGWQEFKRAHRIVAERMQSNPDLYGGFI